MTTVLNLPKAARSAIRKVALDDITVDPRVQREEGLDQRRVNKMAENFNPDALGLFILSERPDGTLICLDAMHRRAVALQAGWKKPVDARVFTGLTLAEEAALFLLYNDKKDPSAISRFKARVLAGDEIAVDIDRIVRKLGWSISADKVRAGVISAVEALERVYRTGVGTLPEGAHADLTERTLATITSAWGHEPTGTHKEILSGIAQLYGRYENAVDTIKLIHELQDTQPRALIGKAKTWRDIQGGTVSAALAKILVGLHNNRRRTNLLPEWVWVR